MPLREAEDINARYDSLVCDYLEHRETFGTGSMLWRT